MKHRIMILEDNYYTYFTAKQLVASQLKVRVETVTAMTESDLVEQARQWKPTLIVCRPDGGVLGLLDLLQKRGINRRNAVVTFVVTPELDRRGISRMSECMDGIKTRQQFGQREAQAA